jgi:hypothetical protein
MVDRARTSLNRDSWGRNSVAEGFPFSTVVYHRIDWHPASAAFLNVWQLSLVLLFLDVLLFGRDMSIICIDSFSVCLWGREGNIMSRILVPQILTCDALPRTKCLPENVSCDLVVRIGRIHLNKLMGTTGTGREPRLFGE